MRDRHLPLRPSKSLGGGLRQKTKIFGFWNQKKIRNIAALSKIRILPNHHNPFFWGGGGRRTGEVLYTFTFYELYIKNKK